MCSTHTSIRGQRREGRAGVLCSLRTRVRIRMGRTDPHGQGKRLFGGWFVSAVSGLSAPAHTPVQTPFGHGLSCSPTGEPSLRSGASGCSATARPGVRSCRAASRWTASRGGHSPVALLQRLERFSQGVACGTRPARVTLNDEAPFGRPLRLHEMALLWPGWTIAYEHMKWPVEAWTQSAPVNRAVLPCCAA